MGLVNAHAGGQRFGPCARDYPWYEFSMKSVAKVAVSLPVDTFKSLERVRVRMRKTRSGAVTEAIERWLQSEEVGDDERRYLEGYLRNPERAEDSAAVAAQSSRPGSLGSEARRYLV